MTTNIWDSQYEELLRREAASGGLAPLPGGDERRAHPRLAVKARTVSLRTEERLELADISLSGMALLSGAAYRPGQTVSVSLEKDMVVEAEVVDCGEEPGTADQGPSYRVRLRFINEIKPREILLIMQEMKDHS
ncbi:MAG: PilZ domain-containing protein [Deltaproteobacteria bacterium]|nr:PilZ domain-containing protein [Deltaproteobacteria bacterium]